MRYYETLEDKDMSYVDMLNNCEHENVTWVEELITENANVRWIGYKCDECNEWVDKDNENEE